MAASGKDTVVHGPVVRRCECNGNAASEAGVPNGRGLGGKCSTEVGGRGVCNCVGELCEFESSVGLRLVCPRWCWVGMAEGGGGGGFGVPVVS